MGRWIGFGALLFVLGVFAWLLNGEYSLIKTEPVSAWLEDHKADCAVVVTGGPGRIREGFDLLSQGQVRKLIISGVHPRANMREIFPQWPFYGSLRPEDVVLEKRSTTTFGNAQQSLPLVEALRCRSVILITSQIHMRRAFKTFRATYPPEVLLQGRAVSSGSVPGRFTDLVMEALKSLFYAAWVY